MDLLYEVEGQVNPTCHQSHIRYSFYVKEEYKEIKIDFEYDPLKLKDHDHTKEIVMEALDKYEYTPKELGAVSVKTAADFIDQFGYIQNLITLSIDDPEGFRGATHQHKPTLELKLNEAKSSPGLESRRNVPGIWDFTLSLHALITEKCTYQLKIWGYE